MPFINEKPFKPIVISQREFPCLSREGNRGPIHGSKYVHTGLIR